MAVENDDVPASNEANNSNEEKSLDHFAGKPRTTKKVPHYLRASTGSCHDACKHGITHNKPTRPERRRMSAPLPHGKKTVKIEIYVDKKVQKAVQSNDLVLPSAKESAPANSKLIRNIQSSRKSPVHDSSKVVKLEARSSTKSSSPDAPKGVKKVVPSLGKSSLPNTLKISKHEVASTAKKPGSSNRIPLNPRERNVSEGPPNSWAKKPSSSSTTMKISKPEVASAAKKSVSLKQTSINFEGRNGSIGPLNPNSRGETPSSSLGSLRLRSKQTSETKVGDNLRTSRVAVVKTVALSAASLSLRTSKVEVKKLLHPSTAGRGPKEQNRRSQAFVKNQMLADVAEPKELADEKVEEKTVHMIETEDHPSTASDTGLLIQPPSPLSPESLNSSSQGNSLSFTSREVDDQCELDSEYTDSEAEGSVSNYNSSGDSKAADSLKEGKELIHDSEGRDPASLKLKFRKGKVVEHQSETNIPRRLRFGQGRTLGDNQDTNSGAQRNSYKKRAADYNKKEAETGVAKVVLKHQEMETKKDEQVSYNNVIEETASKLVEKRKSKVKALVGAFETVISLQERKPSAAADR
ncbi:uncharacterized protein LOC110735067 [Chenopodium quinoa]|uniref:Calmodulin-binding domain-containing protein n=1 Tax=Chenopodium quinoa TaxID=63459 RepID=A0A803LSF6_CHEQI|nr:uncharacterized protein LOC110735067 [Chenopodium quinoa]XP_021770896.1 uncharacterized protein LOC110735067 [Chenopodium quinoa]